MVHLRIVVPSYQAEHALDLLEATPSVCNVIYLGLYNIPMQWFATHAEARLEAGTTA